MALTSTLVVAQRWAIASRARSKRVAIERVGGLKQASPPAAAICRTRSLPRSALRPTIATRAPASASAVGHAAAQHAGAADDNGRLVGKTKEIVHG